MARIVGIDRPWLAALAGVFATAGAFLLYEAIQPRVVPPPTWLGAAMGAVGFAIGAVSAITRLTVVRGAGLTALLLMPFVVSPSLHRVTQRADREERFGRLGLPLLVVGRDGYHITAASASLSDHVLTVWLSNGPHSIKVVTTRLPANFDPPRRCGPTISEIVLADITHQPFTSSPCQGIGPDHWVRIEQDEQVHLVRHGEALVYVCDEASGAELEALVADLTEVTPRRLAELSVR